LKNRFKHLPLYRETDCGRGNVQRKSDLIKLHSFRMERLFNTD